MAQLGHIRLYGKKTLEGSLAFALVSLAFFVPYMASLYRSVPCLASLLSPHTARPLACRPGLSLRVPCKRRPVRV